MVGECPVDDDDVVVVVDFRVAVDQPCRRRVRYIALQVW